MKFKKGDHVIIKSHEFDQWDGVRSVVISIEPKSHFPINILVPNKPEDIICMMEDELILDKEYNITRILNKIDNG